VDPVSNDQPPFERPPRPDQPESTPRHRFSAFLIFGIAAFAVVAFYLALVVVTQADEIFFPGNELKIDIGVDIPGIDVGDDPAAADDPEDRINILVLGLDLRRDEHPDTPARTDSVFVFTVDPFSKTAGIFSIPRDLNVEIPDGDGGYFENRINVAYEMGELRDYQGGGPGLAIDTVEHNFGIPIDFYAVLNFNNFVDLIDEIGGIDIDVPAYAFDPEYNDCNACPYYAVQFVPGPEHMDGDRALAYARIRKSDNDFKRIERQQLVIRATANQALDLGLVLPDEIIRLYGTYKDAVKTNISDFKLPGLARLAQQIDLDNIRMVSIAEATFPCAECPGAMLTADWDRVEELMGTVFGDGRLQAEAAVVAVRNGTQTPGLAGEFAGFLGKQGFAADQIAVDEYADGVLLDNTLVVDLSGKGYTAEKLADWLDIPSDRVKSATDAESQPWLGSFGDVVVVLGADAHLPGSVAAITGD
jgi:LCP family protein required for cell wall assembly